MSDRPPGKQWLKQVDGLSLPSNRKPRSVMLDGTGTLGSSLPTLPLLAALSPSSRMATVGLRVNGEEQSPFY